MEFIVKSLIILPTSIINRTLDAISESLTKHAVINDIFSFFMNKNF